MEPFLDNKEEQERIQRRRERIESMRREKEQQEKRRSLIKKLLPFIGGGTIGLIIIIIIAVTLSGKAAGDGEVENTTQTEMSAQGGGIENTEQSETVHQSTGSDASLQNGVSQEQDEVLDDGTLPEATDTSKPPVASQTPKEEPTEKPSVSPGLASYTFQETADTVTIYNEEVISSNAILIDESTDTIVATKGARERISPASMTKVLTVLVAAEHISEEDLDDTFTMTLEITDYAYINDCSSVGFLKDEEVTVRDLFYGTILPSGGDAAVGLATYVAGSHEAFVEMMNEKLEELGLSDSAHFTNCVGLYDENHYCTVYDMAVIMKAALQNEWCREVLSAHSYTTAPTTQHPEGILISNWFLRRIEDKETGGEVLCAKTGYVVQSQSCAVSYGTFADGKSYICVTTGASSSWRCIYDHVEIYTSYIPMP
ncbi:MAG: D-alanyl-D-alanine carboxypeptidase [Lachnospiraceae bacterium]|nr:D-alanyl-D-alanine carboxypeptidase [Lachnospiraceae bacterium]